MHDTQLKDAQLKDAVAAELDATRRRTLALLEPLGDDDLRRQHSALMSPLVWDLAHVGNYEDIWLLRGLGHEGGGATTCTTPSGIPGPTGPGCRSWARMTPGPTSLLCAAAPSMSSTGWISIPECRC